MKRALVVGGGPAGAALAVHLARAGRAVTLVEREAGPSDKVCGEFLSREACLYLAELGVDPARLGAVPIDHVRLAVGAQRVVVRRLPFTAQSLSRRALDEALLARAGALGADLQRGVGVQALTAAGGAWTARLADGRTLHGDDAFLATGKHDLRGWKRGPGLQDDLVAFKQHWTLALTEASALARHVELVLFDGGYAGLQSIEGGRANLCLLVRQRRFAELGDWDALLAAIRRESPHLDARLAGATPCSRRPLSLAAIPYGYVAGASDGLYRLGDQGAVVPSFSGDGMSIALHSAKLAASTYLGGGTADAFQRRLARDLSFQVRLATALSLALVRRPAQLALGAAARWLPGFLSAVATQTRVPESALIRAGVAGAASDRERFSLPLQ